MNFLLDLDWRSQEMYGRERIFANGKEGRKIRTAVTVRLETSWGKVKGKALRIFNFQAFSRAISHFLWFLFYPKHPMISTLNSNSQHISSAKLLNMPKRITIRHYSPQYTKHFPWSYYICRFPWCNNTSLVFLSNVPQSEILFIL